MRRLTPALLALVTLLPAGLAAQEALVLRPDRVYDGELMRAGWSVLVRDGRIAEAGPSVAAPRGAREIRLPGATLIPGMIEGHSHLLLHPYDETPWNDQVLFESLGERVARGTEIGRASCRERV